MKIFAKQIDSSSLTEFINEAVSGGFFSGQLNSYIGANGYFGPNLVYTSGGSQIISGQKTFDASPLVPYSGGTGTAPSRKYVDDQNTAVVISFSGNYVNGFLVDKNSTQIISGLKIFTGAVGVGEPTLLTHAATMGYVNTISGAISSGGYSIVKVTGSSALATVNLTGAGGTIVQISGNYVLISGAGAGAAASNSDGINLSGNLNATGRRAWDNAINLSGNLNITGRSAWDNAVNLSGRLVATGALLSALSVTGSSIMQTPNLTGMGGTLVIRSGNYVLISGAGGGGGSSVSITGSNTIAIPNFTGVDGVIIRQSGNYVLISGGAGAGTFVTTNVYNVTGTGTIYFTSTGNTVTNTINVTSGTIYFTGASSVSITGSSIIAFPNFTGAGGTLVYQSGNYVLISGGQNAATPISSNASYDMSFFLDSVQIGDNLFETFVSNNYTVSGVAFGCRTTGSAPLNGGILTGKVYQVDFNNTEQTILNFTFNTGVKYAISGGLNVLVTGKNRVGLSITNTISSIQNFTVGVFGA